MFTESCVYDTFVGRTIRFSEKIHKTMRIEMFSLLTKIFVIIIFFSGHQMNAAQNIPTRSELEALMKKNKVPGLSLIIIENAEITAHVDLGVKNSQKQNLIDKDTLFEAASLSKPVFTYGILKLVEKGALD